MMNSLLSFLLVISLFSGQPDKKTEENSSSEISRPKFHFTCEKNNYGSPTGLFYYEEEYHMFYDFASKAKDTESTILGHAVSKDLVHWTEIPVTFNGKMTPEILTVSVFIDINNALGKQTGNIQTLVAFYTDKDYKQQIAYSSDKGTTWNIFENTPIIPCKEEDNACSSKIIWHKPSGKWIMLLSHNLTTDSRGTSVYVSEDLINWEKKSDIPVFEVCSDLVEFNVENIEHVWILFNNKGSYLFGNFDGEKFFPIKGNILNNNYGKSFLSPHVFSNLPDSDNRIIQVACMQDNQEITSDGLMSFPTELSVKKTTSGYKLKQRPIEEIMKLYGNDFEWKNKNIIPGINANPLKRVKGECFHIIADFNIKTSNNFGFVIRHGRENMGTEIIYNVSQKNLSFLGINVPLEITSDDVSFEILVDETSIELYINEGEIVISNKFSPVDEARNHVLFTNGGELGIEKLDVYSIKSMWHEK